MCLMTLVDSKTDKNMQETDDVGFFFEQYYMLILWFVYLVVD